MNVDLAGSTVGTWLQKYRDGKMAFGLSLWGPGLSGSGRLPGIHAGAARRCPRRLARRLGPALEKLAARARVTTAAGPRALIYRQIQSALNSRGPFVPLLQPTQVFVSTRDLKNAVFNPQYQIDVTQVAPSVGHASSRRGRRDSSSASARRPPRTRRCPRSGR